MLLIPESTSDVIGMYSPVDGTYLGDLINGSGTFSTPINAVQGPDGNIYVSDQVADAVFAYDTTGAYQFTYCSGYDNLRGLAFRDGHLFVTSATGVFQFSGPDAFVRNFITSTGCFDIQFLPDGKSLVSYNSGNNVCLHDTNGAFISQVYATTFPEQVQSDPVLPGGYLCPSFSANVITDFDTDGTVSSTLPFTGGRGVYRLGNRNLLVTSGNGVQELDSLTGAVVQTERTGQARFIELFHYVPPPHAFGEIDTTITITGPGDYTLAGITFCPVDSNFYFVSMNDDSVYRLDPDDWSYAPAFAVDNGAGEIPWGISWDGANFWVGQVEGGMTYVHNKQYTFAGAYTGTYYNATGIGGSGWMGGMDFDGTRTWQLAVGGSNKLYRLDLPGGVLVDSIPSVFWGSTSQRGCSWIPWTSQFLSGGWTSQLLYLVDTLGNMVNSAPMTNMADVDIYDFINEGQELWGLVTINGSPSTINKVWLGISRPTGVEGRPVATAEPEMLSLMPNYPNPMRGQTTIRFSLPKAGPVRIAVYNVMGQKVRTLAEGAMNAGYHSVNWNGRNESGQAVSAGVYLYSVSAGGQSATRKLVVVR
ncbi:MAG: T9SS type A sorting domain-containing protein [Candidatus Edwardsbacteria bacterium]|nr:T9SS type A sorting domain-containing protein [Candidatus Edwardsbacteria bacterium]